MINKHRKAITIFVVAVLAAAVTIGAIAYHDVFAAAPSTNSTSSSNSTVLFNADGFGGMGVYGGFNNEDLASALGITTTALNAAYKQAYSAELAKAVSDGLITQAQADSLTSGGAAFPFGKRLLPWLAQNGLDFKSFLAQALGISENTLEAAFQTAFNTKIDRQVTDGKLTQDQADLLKGEYALYNDSTFQSSMKTAFTSAVDAAVASGVITQSQADQILSKSSHMPMFNPGGPGGPRGQGNGPMPDMNDVAPELP